MKFIIHLHHGWCRITAQSVLAEVRQIADGGCIMDLQCLTDEMHRICEVCRARYHEEAIFEVLDQWETK